MSKNNPLLQELFILLASTLTVMAGATISPALKQISLYFSEIPSIELLTKLILTITSLAIAIGAPIAGVVIDKWGRKTLLVTATLFYGITSTIGFYVINLYLILVSRIFLGFAVAGIMTSCTTLIADYYQGEKRNRVLGFQAAFMSFGGAIFIVVGGALANINWNYSFLVYFISLLMLPGIILFIKEPPVLDKIKKVDTNKIQENTELEISLNNKEIKKFPLQVGLISFLLIFIVMTIFYFIPPQFSFYLSLFNITNGTLIGLAIATSSITSGIIALFYKSIRKYLDFQVIFILALLLLAIGYLILALTPNFWLVFLGTGILGFGWGLFMPNIVNWLLANTPLRFRGRILGIYSTTLYLGQFISPLIGEPIINVINLNGLFLIGSIILFSLILLPVILLIFQLKKNSQASLNTSILE